MSLYTYPTTCIRSPLIAESFLAHGAESLNGSRRQQIIVNVDAETLIEQHARRCELAEDPGIPAGTSRRLACDASVVRIIEKSQGEPLDAGRNTRTIPPAIRRASNSRDEGCRFPGSTHTRLVDGHYRDPKHWANGGETKLSNLVLLCRFHHRLVHEGGVAIERIDDGAFRFVHPDGRVWSDVSAETCQRQTDWTRIPALHREHGIAIDAHTARTHWLGETMDYGLAVEALLQRRRSLGSPTPVHPAR